MHPDPRLFVVESPPAPPPPGFFPEDASLYKGLPILRAQDANRGLNETSPRVAGSCVKRATVESMTARERSVLRTCAPILPCKLPETNETNLRSWRLALANKRKLVAQLADTQLDCEELESDVMEELGEEATRRILSEAYNLGDAHSARSRFMLSASNITYKGVEKLAP